MKIVKIYDTTLRDGTQAEDIAFAMEDKLRIAQKLDELGIHYIEGGWPGSNPKDIEFFEKIKHIPLKRAKIAAFGSTRRAGLSPEDDPNLKEILAADVQVATIFGKTWDFHVKEALRIGLDENLALIYDSLAFLKARMPEVIYDAEHFFDGFKANPDYSMKTLKAAEDAGVDCIVLCDTNGGTLPFEIESIVEEVQKSIKTPLGIHTHNDSETAVANTVMAVRLGVNHVQGTINGYGERCGNANLCSIIPVLEVKLGISCIGRGNLRKLKEVSSFVNELANMRPNIHQPFVGKSAFAHKGGVHVSAIQKNPHTYEHIRPELVGNLQRILVSDLSGKSNILAKAAEYNIDLDSNNPAVDKILDDLKNLEHQGYQFEGADASFELLMRRHLGEKMDYFTTLGFKVTSEKRQEDEKPISEAIIRVKVEDNEEHTAALGNGPVNALDNAIRKALEKFYPSLKEVKLLDYKVRILSSNQGTAAITRVLIESGDKEEKWGTVGVGENIIHASWQALVDSLEYKLSKDERKQKNPTVKIQMSN